MRLRHSLQIGERTAEELKIQIGTAYEKKVKKVLKIKSDITILDEKSKDEKADKVAIVRGRDMETGLPKSLRVSESEIREALSPILSQIVESIADVLEESPPELLSDILERGILLTGGGAKLEGFDQLVVERTHMPVVVSNDPLTSVVRGTGKVLEDHELLERVKIIGGLK
jgi:rod shape-determining protein MreB